MSDVSEFDDSEDSRKERNTCAEMVSQQSSLSLLPLSDTSRGMSDGRAVSDVMSTLGKDAGSWHGVALDENSAGWR